MEIRENQLTLHYECFKRHKDIYKRSHTEENFYKVGITLRDIEKRLKEFNEIYQAELIYTLKAPVYNLIKYETDIIASLTSIKYKPKQYFKGHTECFMENPLNYYYYYETSTF